MKGFHLIALVIAIGFGLIFSTGFSFKETACKAACEETNKKCEKEAGDDELKKAACQEAYEECIEECKKKK
jgi:hypothetical protein